MRGSYKFKKGNKSSLIQSICMKVMIGTMYAAMLVGGIKINEILKQASPTATTEFTITKKSIGGYTSQSLASMPISDSSASKTLIPPYIMTDHLTQAMKENEDTIGWITIEDTIINYPVLHASDNEFYLKHDFDGEKSKAGAIFLDAWINPAQYNNLILYGHNMKNGSMFAEITKYKNPEFYESHPLIQMETRSGIRTYKVFSVYIIDGTEGMQFGFDNDEEFAAFMESIYDKSMIKCDPPAETLQILTLITCSYENENARTIVHAYPAA